MDLYTTIGATIRLYRIKRELSQEDLGKLIGVAPTTISMYEKGIRKPELQILKNLSEALAIPLAQLIDIEIPKNNIDIALRSQKLDHEEVEQVKDYISQLKYSKREKQMARANRILARKRAKEILQELKITEPPVKISSIANYLEIDALKGDETIPIFKKTSAFIDLEDKILVYKDSDPIVRKRFSVAHEIGHFVLSHTVKNDIFDIDSFDYREIEANMFAAEILMPFDWVKKDMQLRNMSIKDLAKKYWVSEEAMGWRLFKSDSLLLA